MIANVVQKMLIRFRYARTCQWGTRGCMKEIFGRRFESISMDGVKAAMATNIEEFE
jgi:hypothetical protein